MSTPKAEEANSTPSSHMDPGPDFLVVPDPSAFGERRGSKVRVSEFAIILTILSIYEIFCALLFFQFFVSNFIYLGHTCFLVRRTIVVCSIKDFPLPSMAVWTDQNLTDGPPKMLQTSKTLQNGLLYSHIRMTGVQKCNF